MRFDGEPPTPLERSRVAAGAMSLVGWLSCAFIALAIIPSPVRIPVVGFEFLLVYTHSLSFGAVLWIALNAFFIATTRADAPMWGAGLRWGPGHHWTLLLGARFGVLIVAVLLHVAGLISICLQSPMNPDSYLTIHYPLGVLWYVLVPIGIASNFFPLLDVRGNYLLESRVGTSVEFSTRG